jgi:hypothetical protein
LLWFFPGLVPLVFDIQDKIYADLKITFTDLNHLEYLGLIKFESTAGFSRIKLGKQLVLSYYGRVVVLTFKNDLDNHLKVGNVLLTKAGEELAVACGATASDEFFMFVISQWIELGLEPYCPINIIR